MVLAGGYFFLKNEWFNQRLHWEFKKVNCHKTACIEEKIKVGRLNSFVTLIIFNRLY